MPSYSKSAQLGKLVNPKKKNKDGKTVSRIAEWDKARIKLKTIYISHKITKCEYVSKSGKKCASDTFLTFAHKNKRKNLEPGDLDSINETLLLCQKHHLKIEYDKQENTRLFSTLRPKI